MKLLLFVFFTVISIASFAQKNLKGLRMKSWQAFAFRISASEAEQYLKWDSIPLSRFENAEAAMTFPCDSVDESLLSAGNYVIIDAHDNNLNTYLFNSTNLQLLTINNQQRLQLDVRNKQGELVEGAKVYVNDKEIKMDPSSKTFWVKSRRLEDAIVKVYAGSDTLYSSLEKKDDYTSSLFEQRRQNYHRTKIYRILRWVPAKLKSLFRKKRYSGYTGTSGYMIFNQPKYKIGDTLKFKGYMVDKKWKQYQKEVEVYLSYYSKGKYIDQLVRKLKPGTPGAYFDEFILPDTLVSGIRYTLSFRKKSSQRLLSGEFKIEDYVLDEINAYNFRAGKAAYYPNDTLQFFANAKDANGLNVLDADAELTLEAADIKGIFQDTVFVKDTLYHLRRKLVTDGDTKFSVPATAFPKANLEIKATLRFINSSNEVQEKTERINYSYVGKEITVRQEMDSIYVAYLENGISVPAKGYMEVGDGDEVEVNFPSAIKIDGLADEYDFSLDDDADITKSFEPENYNLAFSRISTGDTLGFTLNNPNRIPVYFTVLDGKKVIATGRQTDELISWKKIMDDHRRYYMVKWQYMWLGEEQRHETSIGLLYKLLSVELSAKDKIFPGQKDSIKIKVTDYKGIPAADVNLTAVGYNNQFSKDISMKEPPYLAKYHGRKYILHEQFKGSDLELTHKSYDLGTNKKWIDKFRLDTMLYYRFLFPGKEYLDVTTLLSSFLPQVSVNVVKDGVPQEIYLMHINRQPEYYNGTTDTMKYSFLVYPGQVKFNIRLRDYLIEIDSIYIQPNYKHDLSFDFDHLPANSKVTKVAPYWSREEREILERTIWRMQDYDQENAYVWQREKVVRLGNGRQHINGPFTQDSLQFFQPRKFDIAFMFEPGYEYRLSKKVVRLEKKPLFSPQVEKYYLPLKAAVLKLGDTLIGPPLINYDPVKVEKQLPELLRASYDNNYTNLHSPGTGILRIEKVADTVIRYAILKKADSSKAIIMPGRYWSKIYNIPAGQYHLLLVDKNYLVAEREIILQENGTLVADMKHAVFSSSNPLLMELIRETALEDERIRELNKEDEHATDTKVDPLMPLAMLFTKEGGTNLSLQITDAKSGLAIPYAGVMIKGYRPGGNTDAEGYYNIPHLRSGTHTLIVTAIGYTSKEILLELTGDKPLSKTIALSISADALEEVVVVGYGVQRKKSDLGYATATISAYSLNMTTNVNVATGLQGRVSGLNITAGNDGADSIKINLRGIRSLTNNADPMLILDGIITPMSMLATIRPEDILDIVVLTGASASAIYGPEAAQGAVVVTTKTKTDRKTFRDYATWQPNLLTDKNGYASFETTYPDNITAWKTYVIAMDKKARVGKTYMLTQSYKPIVAQLNLPLFLIEGDSCYVIGKTSNYTTDKYSVTTNFKLNGQLLAEKKTDLMAGEASIDPQLIYANAKDTLSIGYNVQSTTGFRDGEERKLPVLKKGTEETLGNFWMLQRDTTIYYALLPGATGLSLYAQNNTLDVLLDELEHLKDYPYQCMEQTTSKFVGLSLKKKIYQQLNKKFTEQKTIDKLLAKIQSAQLFDGSWPWWEKGTANLQITTYITNALLTYRSNALIETNIRNAFLYFQHKLPELKKEQLVTALFTLSEGHHEMNYESWLKKIDPDSIGLYARWQLVRILQEQKLDYGALLKKLVGERNESMTGGIHWGYQNYSWYSNDIAITVLAYTALKQEPAYEKMTQGIIRYFLEKRKSGHWTNTVESASITAAILPEILQGRQDVSTASSISISGDTNFVIHDFPFGFKNKTTAIKNILVSKSGSGLVYFTAYQKIFVPDPLAVTDNFIIHTSFQKNGQTVESIRSGEKIRMLVEVEALKEAEYVMLQVPIPAGCIYTEKGNRDWNVYREASKDRITMFTEYMSKGKHTFEIELSPRYNGVYSLNPAKAELMYYPTFFGRNDIKKITIAP